MPTAKHFSIKGDLSASEDLTIDFSFEGLLDAAGHRVTTTQDSRVQATLNAGVVVVHGQFDGHITAERLELAPTAVVSGSIMSGKLMVAEGATVNGPVNTERARAAGEIAKRRRQNSGKAES